MYNRYGDKDNEYNLGCIYLYDLVLDMFCWIFFLKFRGKLSKPNRMGQLV